MLRYFLKVFVVFMVITLLAACQNTDEQGEEKKGPEAKAKSEQKSKANDDRQAKILDEEKQLSQPKGGSERKNRVISPVSNDLLQRKFPETVVLRGSSEDNRVALTFDDGPDRRFTPQVLDVLKKHNVKATFFLMGSRVKELPEITKRIHDEGHSIGNHTYWHPKLFTEGLARMRWELTETDEVLERTVGFRPKLFRAPYGGLNEALVEGLRDMDLSVVGWDVDSLDWMQLSSEEVEKNVLSNVHPGSIILMHSGGHWSQDLSGMVEALDQIIPKLHQDGIQFVTVSELLDIQDKQQ